MTRVHPSLPHPERPAGVVPLRGSPALLPSSVFVRARLGEGLSLERVRAAISYFAEACELAREAHGPTQRWWSDPLTLRVEVVAGRALLPLEEAEAAHESLCAAGLLIDVQRGVRIDADALCECPCLGSFDLGEARRAVLARGDLAPPTLALLRELVRLADAEGVARVTIPRLLEDLLYGRTRFSQALGVLERLSLVERRDLPNRMVELRLRSSHAAAGGAPPHPVPPASRPAPASARMRLPTNAPLQIGGESIDLLPGIVPELERGADGEYYLWLGPVRLGPYPG